MLLLFFLKNKMNSYHTEHRRLFEYEEGVTRNVLSATQQLLREETFTLRKWIIGAAIEDARRTAHSAHVISEVETDARSRLVECHYDGITQMMGMWEYIRGIPSPVVMPRSYPVFTAPIAIAPLPPKFEALIVEPGCLLARHNPSAPGNRGVVQVQSPEGQTSLLLRHSKASGGTCSAPATMKDTIVLVAVGRCAAARVAIPTKIGATTVYTVSWDVTMRLLKLIDSDGDEVARDGQWTQAAIDADPSSFVLTVQLNNPMDWVEILIR